MTATTNTTNTDTGAMNAGHSAQVDNGGAPEVAGAGVNFDNWEYAGFWARVGAMLIDAVLLALISLPLLLLIYGEEYLDSTDFIAGPADFVISWVFPAIAIIVFWAYKSATPGKMVVHAKIVDEKSGKPPSVGQCIGRYFAYIISTIPLGLGYLWVAFDKKKQGWHDKLAGTVVIKPINPTEKVDFPKNKENRREHSD